MGGAVGALPDVDTDTVAAPPRRTGLPSSMIVVRYTRRSTTTRGAGGSAGIGFARSRAARMANTARKAARVRSITVTRSGPRRDRSRRGRVATSVIAASLPMIVAVARSAGVRGDRSPRRGRRAGMPGAGAGGHGRRRRGRRTCTRVSRAGPGGHGRRRRGRPTRTRVSRAGAGRHRRSGRWLRCPGVRPAGAGGAAVRRGRALEPDRTRGTTSGTGAVAPAARDVDGPVDDLGAHLDRRVSRRQGLRSVGAGLQRHGRQHSGGQGGGRRCGSSVSCAHRHRASGWWDRPTVATARPGAGQPVAKPWQSQRRS